MFQVQTAFGGLSSDDLVKAKWFYSDVLGLELEDDKMGLTFRLPGGGSLFIYDKPDHQPATYTAMNFAVEDIDTAIEELTAGGVTFERYDALPAPQDEKGVLRGLAAGMGPDIAWLKDPAGNILALLQTE